MSCTLSVAGPCRRTLAFSVDRTALQNEIEQRLQALAQRARFKGFRPGHTPLALVRRTYGKEIENEARQAVMNRAFQEAIAEHKLTPVGQPELNLKLLEVSDSGPFTFELSVEVAPDVELKPLEDIPVTVALADVNEAMIEGEVRRFRQQGATLENAPEGAAVDDDAVLGCSITYVVDGQTLEPRAERPVFPRHDIVDGMQVAGSGAQFRDKHAGDVVELEADLPQQFQPAELAGRRAALSVRIDQHRVMVVPPITSELLQRAGVASEDELRARLRQQLELQRTRYRDESADRALEEWLIEQHPLELPEGMLAKAVDRRVHELAHKLMEDEHLDAETGHGRVEAERGKIAAATRRALHASFLLARIARDQNLHATAEELRAQIEELARGQNQEPDALLAEAREQGWLNDLAAQVTEQKTRDWLRGRATITETRPAAQPEAATASAAAR